MPGKLNIGTSGWSYKHWQEIFYPQSVKPANYLEYYSRFFSCVELNSSFYHLPHAATVKGWIKRTPDAFLICPKLSRYITHQLRLENCSQALENFFERFDLMIGRIGPVLIQLPPGLKFDIALMNDFFELLAPYSQDYKFALEIRHRSWISDTVFQLLLKNNIGFVIADSGSRFPYHEAITADFVYLRLHGHEKLYASDYPENEILKYAEKIKLWLSYEKDVWVFFNNDFSGFAIKNAMRLKELLHT